LHDGQHTAPAEGEQPESELVLEYVPRVPVDDYDYDLPNERIAKYPVTPRDSSRLLFCGPQRNSLLKTGTNAAFGDKNDWVLQDLMFTDAPCVIPKGSLVVFNESKVIPARIHMVKPTGGRVEVRRNSVSVSDT
jgi:S-adenosylmethionine:tRNA ribosyltransferase-isomerase